MSLYKKYLLITLFLLVMVNISVSQDLLSGAEHVSFDSINNRYLVSSDLNGQIIQINNDESQSIFKDNLGSCLGNCIFENVLYVSCNTRIRGIDLTTREIIMDLFIPETSQLDGMTTDGRGNLYVVESIRRRIYKINLLSQQYTIFVRNTNYAYPQDLTFDSRNNRLLLCSFELGSPIQGIDLNDSTISIIVPTSLGNFDGINIDTAGAVYVSTWHGDGEIYVYDNHFSRDPILISHGYDGPAGLEINNRDNVIAVPNYDGNRVDFISLFAPLWPTEFKAYSDYTTPGSVNLSWTDPLYRSDGTPLTDYRIHIFRNLVFIAEIDSGVQTFVDTGLLTHHGYKYFIRAVHQHDSSKVDSTSAYAGGSAVPQSVLSLSADDSSDGILIRWINPLHQIDGTPLNDFAYILIYRDGILFDSLSQTFSDTGKPRFYFDSCLGYHFYNLCVRDNESPVNYSVFTSPVFGFGGLLTAYSDNFENNLGMIYRTGSWDTTKSIAHAGEYSLTDSPEGNYDNNANTHILLPPVIINGEYILRFFNIAIIWPLHDAYVEISRNQRKTFSVLKRYNWTAYSPWQDGHADPGDWKEEIFDLSEYDGDTVTIRFRLFAPGSGTRADGWYIDDVEAGPVPQMTDSYSVRSGWNMVSLPLKVSDRYSGNVFPPAVSGAFGYQGSYVVSDSIEDGFGYWLKFDTASVLEVTGEMLLKDTIVVRSGWNMIGSISCAVETADVITIPPGIVRSGYYTYDSVYRSNGNLLPGKGYWVKVSQDGKLILSMFQNSSRNDKTTIKGTVNQEMSWLEFTDSHGYKRALYFIEKLPSEMSLDSYELPPTPPEGAFDVRFASQCTMEAVDSNRNSFPIRIQSAYYPVTVSWKINERELNRWSLVYGSSSVDLEGNGKLVLHQDENLNLMTDMVEGNLIPTEFKLEDNYPNPFNPSTTIRYQLPSESKVSVIIFNVLGQIVDVLVNEVQSAGFKTVIWCPEGCSGGVYFYSLEAVNVNDPSNFFKQTRKTAFIK